MKWLPGLLPWPFALSVVYIFLYHQALCVWVSSVVILVLRHRQAIALIDRFLSLVLVRAWLRAS